MLRPVASLRLLKAKLQRRVRHGSQSKEDKWCDALYGGVYDDKNMQYWITMPAKKYSILAGLLFLLIACSTQKLVVRQMIPVLRESARALYAEPDLQLAETALASNLKLLEGLLQSDQQNEELLLLLAQGYAGYALAFAEDSEPQRAKVFYLRAKDFALRALEQDKIWNKTRQTGLEALHKMLQTYGKEKVPALFWAAFAWSGYINLALDEPQALLDLTKVELLMRRVEQLQPDYYYGSVYLFWGSLYGSKPALLGGDLGKARKYFEKALKLTDGHFLLAYVYAAQFYAAKTLDETLFDQYLNEVAIRPADSDPQLTMFNQVAKRKAKILSQKKEDLF